MIQSPCRSLLLLLSLAVTPFASAQAPQEFLDQIKFRELGPWRGGRSCAVSGVPGRKDHFYMGTTGGGVWKSEDSGVNWKPVSDGFFKSGSVGAIAVSRSNPDVVYVGMGETDIRGNISHGDGVYKSVDAGATWKNIGLAPTKFISKIRVHPADPNTLWVAALGPVYGKSKERGVFKSTDGGATWRKTLYENDRAGAINLVLDPSNPNRLFASTWEAWRTPWTMNSGGPGSKIFVSEDAGETWKDISRSPGLPTGTLGKIGLTISPANPKNLWAHIEAEDGGIFRSTDGGATWSVINTDRRWRQRAWYYTHVIADTKEENTIYVLNVQAGRSKDGGKSFEYINTPHSDHHDLWIDPEDNRRMIVAEDGGGSVSVDGGRSWTEQDYPTAQMYHVSTDRAFPYNVLGAQQDNSTVRIPSRTRGRGIGEEDWTSTAGGESGYVVADPLNPDLVMGGSYGGSLDLMNHRTNVSRDISPWPDNPMGSGADSIAERFQWTFPIQFSVHERDTAFCGSQHVWKTTNLGGAWKRISPDLTRNDKSTMGSSGGPITKDNTSVEYYGTVFTIAESHLRKGLIWAGSDDGLIHVTLDGGKKWTNVTPKELPEWATVSLIEASSTQPGRAWAAVDNHEQDDDRPYIYLTEDFGRTWEKRVVGIDSDHFVKAVREDPVNPNLVFAGTEFGFYVSLNGGASWQRVRANLPVVPIHDMAIAQDDLILATHGRSFWVLDDLSALRQSASLRTSKVQLFKPRDSYRVRFGGPAPAGASAANNPPGGAGITYWLPDGVKKAELFVLDSQGQALTSVTAPTRPGLNRVSPVLSVRSYTQPQGFIFWAAGPMPIALPPGEYRIRLTVDGASSETVLRHRGNPLSPATDQDLVDQYNLALAVSKSTDDANKAVLRIRELRTQALDRIEKAPQMKEALSAWVAKLTKVEETLHQTKIQSGQDPLNYPIRLNNKLAALLGTLSGDFGPTKQTVEVYEILRGELKTALGELSKLTGADLKEVNAALKGAGLAEIPG